MEVEKKIIEAIDRQAWLDLPARRLQAALHKVFDVLGHKTADLLHGTWLGHPVHSVLTDIPTGAYTVVMVLDAMEMSTGKKAFGKGADAALNVGLVGAVGSAVTGLTDWQHTSGHSRRIGMTHALLNSTALVLYLSSLAARKSRNRQLGWGLSMAGYLLTTGAAYLGGHLVYADRIGVNHSPKHNLTDEFKPVIAEADLSDGKMVRVEVDGVPVLIVRRQGRILAIAETCSHLGGPLSEGELNDDDTVTCPWHGSRFSLVDGKHTQGPSVYHQPCFETRLRGGQIEIRHTEVEHK
jgi:nitrite reductase/ring-hydroxylating ferredoxin subunit/uncharacterized membrane protein